MGKYVRPKDDDKPAPAPAPAEPDFSAMTQAQLDELIAKASATKAAKADEARQTLRAKLLPLIEKSGLSLKEVFREELARKPVEPGTVKYRDAAGNTWSGFSRRPKWLKDALAAGAKLEDFEVKS